MRRLNPDARILDLCSPRYFKLQKILDEDNRWASLLEVLPYDDCNELERVARDAENKSNTSPAQALLFRLASKGATVQMLKEWLKEMQLEKALFVLEDDVPLRIVQEPPSDVTIEEGEELVLFCEAVSLPHPEYQWFKDDEENELEGQNMPTLRIPFAKLDDAGIYACRVHTYYIDGECDVDVAFSNFSNVEVVPSTVKAVSSNPHGYAGCHIPLQALQPAMILPNKSEVEKRFKDIQDFPKCGNWLETFSKVKSNVDSDKKFVHDLRIIKHPISPGTVNQGSTVILECKARSSLPVYYQWYCNGFKMPGETSHELKLSNLYPDTYSGEYFNCEAFTEAERIYSRDASFQLSGFDDSTQYFASDKVALLMANNIYDTLADLKTPPNDAATLSKLLKLIGFKVIVWMNLNLIQMKKAVYIFCESLKKGSYGLIYYAGHGFEQFGQSYFQPVDATESCDPLECVCVEEILQNMQEKETALSVLLIDMCRKLPKQLRNGKNLQPGKIYEPMMKRNVVYGYATSFLCAAYESNKSPNGYFMKHLKEHITKKQSILDILLRVKCDFENDRAVHKLQYPWVGSSLTARRKLTDEIIDETSVFVEDGITWQQLQSSPFTDFGACIPHLGVTVIFEFHQHKEEFCNAADLHLCLEPIKEDACASIWQLAVDFSFNLEDITCNVVQLYTQKGSRICCCIIEIFDLQTIESDFTGTLTITDRQTGREKLRLETIPFVQPPVSKFRCEQFWENLYNTVNENSSHDLIMNLAHPDRSCVPNNCKVQCEIEEDLISFADEIIPSTSDSGKG